MASDESLVNYGLGAIRDARLDIALDDYSSSFFNLAKVNFACIFSHIIAKCKSTANSLQICINKTIVCFLVIFFSRYFKLFLQCIIAMSQVF